jgi:hypothetical protein
MANATTYYVDDNCNPPTNGTQGDPYCTIQEGINASSNGDEVRVAAGTYNEGIDFAGKLILVKATSGAASTSIVRSSGGSDNVTFDGNETNSAILDGFTISGGNGGRGIYCLNASPTIRNSVITGKGGGGVFLYNSAAVIEDTVICRNTATTHHGAGVFLTGTGANNDVTIRRCRIEGNVTSGDGGGIGSDRHGGVLLVEQSIINHNRAADDGGGLQLGEMPALAQYALGSGDPCNTEECGTWWTVTILDSLFFGNMAQRGGAMGFGACIQPEIINVTVIDNFAFSGDDLEAAGTGGGITIGDFCITTIVNSIF